MTEQQNKQYQTIIQARNFHYEQFTRWSSYFYVIIGALFVGYYSIAESSDVLKWVFLCLGYLISVANFLSVKGYIYWWQHWNILLADFEKRLAANNKDNATKETEEWPGNETVYSVFSDVYKLDHPINPLNGSRISTSKVALFVAGIIVLGWSILISYKISTIIVSECCMNRTGCLLGFIVLFTVVLYVAGAVLMPAFKMFQSDMSHNKDLRLLENNKQDIL